LGDAEIWDALQKEHTLNILESDHNITSFRSEYFSHWCFHRQESSSWASCPAYHNHK